MKKWSAVILCLALLCTLPGCQEQHGTASSPTELSTPTAAMTSPSEQEPEENLTPPDITVPSTDSTETTEGTEPTEPATSASQREPLVAVSLAPVLQEETAEDGTSIFVYQYQNITAILPSASGAEKKINETMAARIAETADSATEILNWAKQDYTSDNIAWTPYSCQISFAPERMDSTIISFSGVIWNYTGGIHPNQVLISSNFNASSGEILTLEDVLNHPDMAEALYLKVMDGLSGKQFDGLQAGTSVYTDGYEQTVRNHFNLGQVDSACWYFTDTGMCFYFSPYEIAPYAIGSVEIEIPYEDLHGILKEEYFPIVHTDANAFSINAALGAQIDSEQFAQTIPVTLDAEGEKIAIFSGNVVYNVQLAHGSLGVDEQFAVNQILFAANRLTENDLLLIHAYIPDGQPNLRLTLHSEAEEVRTYYITQSGDDGSILLLEG